MRLYVTLPILLLGFGCQTDGALSQSGDGSPPCRCWPSSSADEEPIASAGIAPASVQPTVAAVAFSEEPTGVEDAQAHSSQPLAPTDALLPVLSATNPNGALVQTRVQTTATYKRQCDLTMDFLPIHIPFPHLRIFQGPDKVVTQTEYVSVPATSPAAAPPASPSPFAGRPPAATNNGSVAPPQVPKKLPRVDSGAEPEKAPSTTITVAPTPEPPGGATSPLRPAPFTLALPAMPSPRIPSSLPAPSQIDAGGR